MGIKSGSSSAAAKRLDPAVELGLIAKDRGVGTSWVYTLAQEPDRETQHPLADDPDWEDEANRRDEHGEELELPLDEEPEF